MHLSTLRSTSCAILGVLVLLATLWTPLNPRHALAASTTPPPQPESIALLSGNVQQIVVNGAFAYVGDGVEPDWRLSVLDVSAGARRIGSVAIPGSVVSLVRGGTLLYAAVQQVQKPYQVLVIDIAIPTTPQLRGSYTVENLQVPASLAVFGQRLFYADRQWSGVTMLDVSNPSVPQFVRTFGKGRWLASSGNRMLALDSVTSIYDMSDPTNPRAIGLTGGAGAAQLVGNQLISVGGSSFQIDTITRPPESSLVGSATTLGSNLAVAVAGNIAAVVNDHDGLLLFSLANPALPALISARPLPGAGNSVAIANGRVYVGGRFGVEVMSLAGLAGAQLLGSASTLYRVTDIAQASNLVVTTQELGNGSGTPVDASLQIFDASNPASPQLLGGYRGLKSAESLAVNGETLYVGGTKTLTIFDIRKPAAPGLVKQLPLPSFHVPQLLVVGQRLYVTGSGLWIYDLQDPRRPQLIGQALIGNWVGAIAIDGNRAYVGQNGGLTILDIGNPAAPVTLGSLTPPDSTQANSVAVRGSIAYLTANPAGMHVIDVQNPAAPRLISTYPSKSAISGIGLYDAVIAGNQLYLAHPQSTEILQLDNPSQPALVATIPGFGGASHIDLTNGRLAVGDLNGLHLLDVSTIHPPTRVASYDVLPQINGIQVVDGIAYAAAGPEGLQILDIHVPTHPRRIGAFPVEGEFGSQAVTVVGGRVYLATYRRGLDILDAHNPAAIIPRGQMALSFGPGGFGGSPRLQVIGSRLYVSSGTGFSVIDISQPSAPRGIGGYTTASGINDFFVVGTTAYITDGTLHIVNMSNPSSPKVLGSYAGHPQLYGVDVVGTRAYIASYGDYNGPGGLLILNVATPSAPTQLGFLSLAPYATYVQVAGDTAMVIRQGQLHVVDVRTPTAPQLVASTDTIGAYSSLDRTDPFVAIGAPTGGFQLFWYQPATAATIGPAGGKLISAVDQTTTTFPAGALPAPTTITHTPRYGPALPAPAGLVGIGHAFELTIPEPGQTTAATAAPFTIAVTYREAERGPAIAATLALYALNDGVWQKLPGSSVNLAAKTITGATNHSGIYAVFGATNQTFLPVTLR